MDRLNCRPRARDEAAMDQNLLGQQQMAQLSAHSSFALRGLSARTTGGYERDRLRDP